MSCDELPMVDEELASSAVAPVDEAVPAGFHAGFVNGSSSGGAVQRKKGSEDERHLSVVSQKYDLGKKGYLDKNEAALRSLDVSDRGYLKIETVYDIMKKMQDEQNKNLSLKKAVVALSVFSVILALSNLGTAFAAAWLAKDSTVRHGDLTDMNGSTLGTTSKGHRYDLKTDSDQRRALAEPDHNLSTQGGSLTISKSDAGSIFSDCESGTPVVLGYTCHGAAKTHTLDTSECTRSHILISGWSPGWNHNFGRTGIVFGCPEGGNRCTVAGLSCPDCSNDDDCNGNKVCLSDGTCSQASSSTATGGGAHLRRRLS